MLVCVHYADNEVAVIVVVGSWEKMYSESVSARVGLVDSRGGS